MAPGRPGVGNPFQPNSRGVVGGGGKGKGVAMVSGGKSGASKLAHAISSNGGPGRLVAIKQEDESGDEDDELESEDDVGGIDDYDSHGGDDAATSTEPYYQRNDTKTGRTPQRKR